MGKQDLSNLLRKTDADTPNLPKHSVLSTQHSALLHCHIPTSNKMAPFHFGALVYNYQAIDVIGPFDLLNSSGKALLSGGPDIAHFELSPKYADFIRRHVAAGKLIFSTCTGSGVLASTGVLDGKAATINNFEYAYTVRAYPRVNWTKDKKWVVDGNIWTGSGAVAGMDMFAHWIKENYGLDVLTLGAAGLDHEPRDIDGAFDTVLKQRYDASGKRLPAHVFPSH